MPVESNPSRTRRFDLMQIDFLPVFEAFDEGVLIADRNGRIVLYNSAMEKIDDLKSDEAVGKKVVEIYDLTDDTSMVMQCLHTGKPLLNRHLYYRTRIGKVSNTIHNVYPLYRKGELIGAICFVKDYRLVEATIATIAQRNKGMGRQGDTRYNFNDIIGNNPELRRCVETAVMASLSPSPIMLCGETGTGKELFAQAIHNHSPRRSKRYIPVNCTAIPENLLEGILFGTTKGAFTGAMDKPGLFERATGGTLFLDEVNSMPVGLQAKILRVVQEKKIRRVGSLKEIDIDIKLISSIDQPPHQAIEQGRLRSDLFYRLGVVVIRIPPLRERKDDLGDLIQHFLRKLGAKLDKTVSGVSDELMYALLGYDWPGNVRELEHTLEGAMNIAWDHDIIEPMHMPSLMGHDFSRLVFGADVDARDDSRVAPPAATQPLGGRLGLRPEEPPKHPAPPPDRNTPNTPTLAETQQQHELNAIRNALSVSRGNVTRAARSLGMSRQLLHYKMRKHHIDRKIFVPQ